MNAHNALAPASAAGARGFTAPATTSQKFQTATAVFQRDLIALIPQLRAFGYSLCKRRDQADDLAQEALAKAAGWAALGGRALRHRRGPAGPAGWAARGSGPGRCRRRELSGRRENLRHPPGDLEKPGGAWPRRIMRYHRRQNGIDPQRRGAPGRWDRRHSGATECSGAGWRRRLGVALHCAISNS
jgi:hypothetical protein